MIWHCNCPIGSGWGNANSQFKVPSSFKGHGSSKLAWAGGGDVQ
jgi:hypothetical protein